MDPGPWSRRRRWCSDCLSESVKCILLLTRCRSLVAGLGLSLQTRNPRIWLVWSHQPRASGPAPALGRAESENWEDWRDSAHQESDHRHAAAGAELWQPRDVTDCPVTRIISPGAERPWPCDNTQSRPEQVCVTSVTRVSNLSHLSSNPSLCWGAVPHSHPAPPALTLGLGPSETAACVQCPHSAGARLTFTTEILAPPRHNWRPIMKSFEYLHQLFVHKNNPCYQTCWLCNDFRIAKGNLRSHPILIVILGEVQLSLESPAV